MRPDDLYPVSVFIGGDQLARARVVTRDGVARVYVDSGRDVVVAHEGTHVETKRVNGSEWELTVAVDGVEDSWTCRRVGGCGCGSRLKRLDVDAAMAS